MRVFIATIAAASFLVTAASAQYDRKHHLKIPQNGPEEVENNQAAMQSYQQQQREFRQQMNEAARQSARQSLDPQETRRELRDALKSLVDE